MQADSPTVLVVDDRTNMLRLTQMVLRQHARVVTAARGMEAVPVIQTQPVPVVLRDLEMPDLDGLDAYGHLTKPFGLEAAGAVVLRAARNALATVGGSP